ncbi:MotA/TolQ/ExbB proton channel family protein [Desulfosporosinus shakirovi]|uniref:MotA/TolQ/ExbB proton channel family protein n=1 Tax=Desulfosporosinus shakirovi TaxID=2885154 RepID=UPI001E47303E|nr:MotA/TolQ/ExbB proton channel family protein [Desulfosporosinus sp. SRJS8]MCB8818498.1 MotA/TolQ/ExbB proton channel family protein [Desulfosporosinus sp. SRJS8]
MHFLLNDILHLIGQGILVPCQIILISLIVISVWQVGDLFVELFMERRKTKVDVLALIKDIHESGPEFLREIIEASRFIHRQKEALYMLIESRDMPRALLIAMAHKLLVTEEAEYEKTTASTDLVAKLGPMFGLLGTLIPLGPGIVALGEGDTAILSASLAIAFDTAIAGVSSAAVSYVISNIRKRWYDNYLINFEVVMECVLEEVAIKYVLEEVAMERMLEEVSAR